MNTLSNELGDKDFPQKIEDPIEELMSEEPFYEDILGDWLQNMKPW